MLHIFGSIRGINLRNNIARYDFPHDTGQLWYRRKGGEKKKGDRDNHIKIAGSVEH